MTTLLEAVNTMLAAIGEAPVEDLDSDFTEVEKALAQIERALREVLSEGLRFNTDFGLVLTPVSSEGGLHTYKVPEGTLSIRLTKNAAQYHLDATERNGKLYDRVNNREGFELSTLAVDVARYMEFETIPEVARAAVLVVATRRFISGTVGSTALVGFSEKDEFFALRNLRRKEGLKSDLNIFDNLSVRKHLGRPTPPPIGFVDNRK